VGRDLGLKKGNGEDKCEVLWDFVLEDGTEGSTTQGGPLEIVGGRDDASAVVGGTQYFSPGWI